MVPSLRPWRCAKATRSGSRAMVPSSFMISQITPDGLRPARRAMSTAASVWPARTSVPPSRAISGKMWPGVTMSSRPHSGLIATATVCARSARRDAGGDALARLDRDGERGLVARAVRLAHQRQAELLDPLAGQRQADQAARVAGHEVDRVGRRELRRDDQVALVLAVLVIDQDEHAAVARLLDQLGGAREVVRRGWRSCRSCSCVLRQPGDVAGQHVDLDVHRRRRVPASRRW